MNPKTGNWERKYYTVTGNEVGSEAEQSVQNLDWRDKWEATTEAGRRHHKLRMQNDFEDHVGAALSKWGGDDAAEKAWQLAEQRSSRELMKEVDKNARRSPLYDLAQASNVTGGLGADNVDMGIKAFASHLKYHDLQRMADDAWNRLGKEKQQGIAGEIYNALHKRYPEASDGQLREAAGKMARQQSDRRVYELAVQKNAPHNAADYFIRKALGQNAMVSLMMSGARAKAGTTGDMEARDVAEQRYGHGWVNKGAGIAGTVVGLMADPLTLVSAGAGSGAVKGSMWLGGKLLGKAATRKAASTLGGRIGAGVLGSAANLGTYMAGSEALDQARWGGKVEGVDPETGRYKIGGYDAGAVGKQLLHGLGMGAVTGTIAPLTGNVSDKLVNATESTAGKAAIRAGELGVGTVAEGTVFALPEFVSTYNDYSTAIKEVADPESPGYIADAQEREKKIEELRRGRGDAMMDVWTDNMAMMAGFKGQHLLKSAPRRIEELAKMPRDAHGNVIKAGFETRLRAMLEGQGNGQALTRDEKEELQRGGYDDLAELVEGYKQSGEVRKARQAKINEGKARGYSDELAAKVADDAGLELPYTRF